MIPLTQLVSLGLIGWDLLQAFMTCTDVMTLVNWIVPSTGFLDSPYYQLGVRTTAGWLCS